MDPAADLAMQQLSQRVAQQISRLKRMTYASDVTIVQSGRGEFTVIVRWKDKTSNQVKEHHKLFTQAYVFGGARAKQYVPQKKACDYVVEVAREVLSKRGVIG
jgi:hypothetical protein